MKSVFFCFLTFIGSFASAIEMKSADDIPVVIRISEPKKNAPLSYPVTVIRNGESFNGKCRQRVRYVPGASEYIFLCTHIGDVPYFSVVTTMSEHSLHTNLWKSESADKDLAKTLALKVLNGKNPTGNLNLGELKSTKEFSLLPGQDVMNAVFTALYDVVDLKARSLGISGEVIYRQITELMVDLNNGKNAVISLKFDNTGGDAPLPANSAKTFSLYDDANKFRSKQDLVTEFKSLFVLE